MQLDNKCLISNQETSRKNKEKYKGNSFNGFRVKDIGRN